VLCIRRTGEAAMLTWAIVLIGVLVVVLVAAAFILGGRGRGGR
jgi:uncharacterized membrane protein